MYTRLCSGVLFPLPERLKGHGSVALRNELERTQWLDGRELEALQFARLRSFLARVGKSVPYYRALYARSGFDPQRLSSTADLQQLPFLTKSLIREQLEQLKSADATRLIRHNTGGSSGEPLVFFLGPDRISHDVAAKGRATRWGNVGS